MESEQGEVQGRRWDHRKACVQLLMAARYICFLYYESRIFQTQYCFSFTLHHELDSVTLCIH